MKFLDREPELGRLQALARRREGGLAVVYGRRRLGKTRLLLEWVRRPHPAGGAGGGPARGGLYTVADASTPEIQRRVFAEAVSIRLPGFADIDYRDWRGLLARLAQEAKAARFRGPIVIDELPYLVAAAPELPSVLQAWTDHEARDSRLVVALAGSSQRMMQGLVLGGESPLYGRAHEVLEVQALGPDWIPAAFGLVRPRAVLEALAAWGGVPRYWELAVAERGLTRHRIERVVLDPLGPLHGEPDRLLLEELPPAPEVRPLLEAIGGGSHRLSEIAGRIGRPATSLARPLDRLRGMGLIRREIPFGEAERSSKRSLYRIADPFLRLWFRVVAPHRARLASSDRAGRLALLDGHWPHLLGEAWEELCRQRLPRVDPRSSLGRLGPWGEASRWWQGAAAEWDVVALSLDRRRLLVGEARLKAGAGDARALAARPLPRLPGSRLEVVRALFVPEAQRGTVLPAGVLRVTAADLVRGLEPG